VKFFYNLSIVNKIIISFFLIIVVFIAIMAYSTYFTTQIRDRHAYLSSYIMSRNRILTHFQREFSGLTNTIRLTFNEPNWLYNATEHELNLVQREISQSIDNLNQLGMEYLTILYSDTLVNDIVGFDMHDFAGRNMIEALAIIQEISAYYTVPEYHFEFEDRRYFSDVITVFGGRVTGIIGMLREHNLDVIENVGQETYAQQDSYFRFNLTALILIVVIASVAAWLLSSNIKKRILALEISADAMKQGYFDVNINVEGNDEMSRLTNVMLEVIYTFRDFVRQVTYTSNEINQGNFAARLNEEIFEGDYQKATIAINNLSRSVIEASSVKAEQAYYSYVKFMMDTVPSVISFWNENLELFDCNEEALRRYKVNSKDDYLEKFALFSPAFQPDGTPSTQKARQLMEKANQEGYLKFDWMHQDIEGNQIPSVITCYKGDLMGKTVIFTYCEDMRDFHKMLEEMERSATAEGSSKAKSKFLARMSHEIRTPISAVLGISEIQLQNPDLTLAVEEAFAKIYSSSQILLGIINDILDLSKIEEDKMIILAEHYDIASLINDIIQLNIFRLGSKKIEFEIDIDENLPKMLDGDALRIKQIMNNLLSNAFKYTDKGYVSLKVYFETKEDNTFLLCFDVSDSGCGMTEDELKLLFHEFVRFNEERNHNIEGIGLGMHIVYNLVELMEAQIDVDSEINVGTNFRLKIPQKQVGTEILGKTMVDNLKTFKLSNRFTAKRMTFKPDKMPYGKVLVVDDVETNLFVANGLLSFYDLQIETCDSGYKALELVQKGNVYDIIFLDQMMPGMDGVETLQLIRKLDYTLPIVALTANALIGQSEFFLENGFDGFISKPIDTSHLNTILIKFIRDKQPQEVIDAANKAQESTSQSMNDMWNFFSGNNSSDNAFAQSLRKEFARTQKNIISDIRQTLKMDDTATCRRHAHTLKGLARTIGENHLADTAAQLESLFEQGHHNEQTTRLLQKAEQQLLKVLASIPPDEEPNYAPLPDDFNLNQILDELEPLLKEGSLDSLDVVEKLLGLSMAKQLVEQVQNFDFDKALTTLQQLR